MSESRSRALASRWLGAGMASVLSVVTIGLAVSGRLAAVVGSQTVWLAGTTAVLVLALSVWSCTLPLGAEDAAEPVRRRMPVLIVVVAGCAAASGAVLVALLWGGGA